MASERNRIDKLKNYITSFGIDVNIGKTKARGNRGVFIHGKNKFRIDVAKNLSEAETISILVHEFTHFIHYKNDKSLKSINFVFGNISDDIQEELINITVKEVPKDFASSIFNTKFKLTEEINNLKRRIKTTYPDFKLSEPYKKIEKGISLPLKYLLKYDNVKIFTKVYSINDLDNIDNLTEVQKQYITLKSKQRYLARINAKITKLNKYYNNPTELLARFCELYYTNYQNAKQIAPKSVAIFDAYLANNDKNIFKELSTILQEN